MCRKSIGSAPFCFYNPRALCCSCIFVATDSRSGMMKFLENLKPLGLLLLGVALGVIFIYQGYSKLFGHTREAMESFVRMGFPGYFVYISGVIEFFCGCMLIVGLFARIAGLLLAVEVGGGPRTISSPIPWPCRTTSFR